MAFFQICGSFPRWRVILKSSDKGSAKEEALFLKNKAGIWSGVLETVDFREEIALHTISIVMFRSTISEIFERTLE